MFLEVLALRLNPIVSRYYRVVIGQKIRRSLILQLNSYSIRRGVGDGNDGS